MKELLQEKLIDEQKEVREIKKSLVHVGKMVKQPGQKVWELNLTTQEFKEADIETVASLDGKVAKKIIMKQYCIYNCAINAKNARKKFFKQINQLIR